ncbi:ABC transporter ATP-binding protein [Pseudokineococcus basanitobsidens]|uniref:ABC transporter ATP-binding protein n=1 Tax=Pseudokineococcus basanitobsidens TaxID=1926649 RepID=A0ABU8RGJ6_9ACTN
MQGVSFEVRAGESVALMGPSGSGKTTVLRVVVGEVPLESGTVEVDGLDPVAARERGWVGFVPQDYRLVPFLSALENVSFALEVQGAKGAQARGTALECLGAVGLGDLSGRRPGELSGGQQQRVAIARALSLRPRVVLADEPTAALDPATAGQSLGVLVEAVRASGAALVMATHDPLVAQLADERLDLREGRAFRAAA